MTFTLPAIVALLILTSIYAVLISFGIGKELDDDPATRYLVIAGAILIVILARTWGDWQEAGDWILWFAVGSLPLVLRAAILYLREKRQAALRQHMIVLDEAHRGRDQI